MTGREVSELRTALDLTPTEFGRLVGVDARSVYRWESALFIPTGAPKTLMRAFAKVIATPQNARAVQVLLSGSVRKTGFEGLIEKMLEALIYRINRGE